MVCKMLKDSDIHDITIIGAQSVVEGEIEAESIAVGVPARVKNHRN